MPSASRLVARMRTPGQARSRASASRAQASSRCSQLSSTSSRRLGRRASASVASSGRPGSSRTPSAPATAWRHQRRVGQRRQLDQPDAVRVARRAASAATCSARRVLPPPPAPVSVTSRCAASSARDLGQLALAPDEAGQLQRQVVRAARPASAGAGSRPAGPGASELEDALRARPGRAAGARPGRAGRRPRGRASRTSSCGRLRRAAPARRGPTPAAGRSG